ncbi:M24 family metallopeptidase [Chengkuizengella axinellae]|uniref:Xaa-Pro peptidase family protein n=1 Tax=Chengkuizengella axinellae TaxID=3064388 RepID=A0ABT9J4K6_9BACL|nr:Xaa-Pro peptidase family protein [Chengkuizengella sp. 2205SS18-9]MDP5276498.1 Xaa-Pro peptidase family protein [Chengkuizengella sp. 2205SS18-9]
MNNRIEKLYDYMDQNSVDVLLITQPQNVYYFTGFLTDPHERFMGFVLVKGEDPFLFVPLLDAENAESVSSVGKIYSHDDAENAYEVLQRYLPSSIQCFGLEKNHLTVKNYESILAVAGADEIHEIDELLQDMRISKSQGEITKIKKAIDITEEALRLTLPKIKLNITEMEIVAELEYQIKKLGAEGPSFSSLVLAGEKAGHPHGNPGDRKIKTGEFLLIDFGVVLDGYVSDLTRTFAIGEVNDQLKDIYDTVLQANLQAIEVVKPGTSIANVDLTARAVIENKGYGQYFINRVGHGFGMEIHEHPSVHSKASGLLREGMTFTIEPGIYNPKLAGVRIEDNVVVTKDGVDVLSTFPKELQMLDV